MKSAARMTVTAWLAQHPELYQKGCPDDGALLALNVKTISLQAADEILNFFLSRKQTKFEKLQQFNRIAA